MTTFLGVPIRSRGVVFGNRDLTERLDEQLFSRRRPRLVEALVSDRRYRDRELPACTRNPSVASSGSGRRATSAVSSSPDGEALDVLERTPRACTA